MKIMTIIGTRPELIRLSIIIKKLDKLVDHKIIFTNQNYDPNLSTIFFNELKIRKPDYYFENKGYSIGQFLSKAFLEFEKILIKEKPDKILILGDTNSGLLALVAKKYNIPTFHMEAGNRCYDERVPEEINRKLIDQLATYNLSYTENSKQNLLLEGFNRNFVFKTGNPIYEVLNYFSNDINNSNVLDRLSLIPKQYVLVSTHRSENVDNKETLYNIVKALNKISDSFKVVVTLHPRTRSKLKEFNIETSSNVILSEPFGLFAFIKLEKNAKLIINDSGTILEESCIFGIPSITIRETTERHEVFECGASVLTGTDYNAIIGAFKIMLNRGNSWTPPQDYLVENVSDIVINFLIGKV